MRRLATHIITYTQTQAEGLAAELEPARVTAAPNALYRRHQFMFDATSKRDAFIFVGRLHPEKKPLLLVEAFERLYAANPGLRLIIVGDGTEAEILSDAVKRSRAHSAIELTGHVGNYHELRRLYSRAIASVCPGSLGLSAIQSLSFGVPIIISRSEPHGPEIEAVVDGENAGYFETDDSAALSAIMLRFANTRTTWRTKGARISSDCRDRYSVEAMSAGILAALKVCE